jgi:hypothetical protein
MSERQHRGWDPGKNRRKKRAGFKLGPGRSGRPNNRFGLDNPMVVPTIYHASER